MSEWKKVKLGDCCDITSSKRIFFSEYEECGIPFYRSKEIIELSKGQTISEVLYISENKYNEIKKRFGVPKEDDIILTSVGSIGIPYMVSREDKFYFKDGNLTWLHNYKEFVYPPYILYWLKTNDCYNNLNSIALGAAQKALTIIKLKDVEIPIPPLSSQQRIATILSRYDSLIENYQKQIKLLEEAAQRLYKEWFVDLRFPGHENTKIINGLPDGWEKKMIGEIAEINKRNIPKNYEYSFVNYTDLGNVRLGNMDSPIIYDYGEEPGRAKRVAIDGDIIWGMVRPNLKSYTLVQYPKEQDVFSTGFAVLTAKRVPFSFLYCHVTTEAFVGYLVNCTNGAAYPAVKPEHFSKAEIVIPSKYIMDVFNGLVEPMFRIVGIFQSQIRLLTEARDRLLPKLMSGEIEVGETA